MQSPVFAGQGPAPLLVHVADNSLQPFFPGLVFLAENQLSAYSSLEGNLVVSTLLKGFLWCSQILV